LKKIVGRPPSKNDISMGRPFMSTRDTMVKKGKDQGPKGRPGERPKGPIGKAEMIQALCTEATYDNLDQWVLDIEAYAGDSDVTEAIKAINEKIEEDIYYTKLFIMEALAANAKTIDPAMLDKMVTLFTDHFPAHSVALAHFRPSKTIEVNALTNGLYINLRTAGRDPASFITGLFASIPKEAWDQEAENAGKEPSNIPLLVAMKAMEENARGAEWPFLQGLETGYDAKIFMEDKDRRWDFKFVFDRVLDRNPSYNDQIAQYLPYLAKVGNNVADPEVIDNVLFWLTSKFCDFLMGNIGMNEPVVKDMFNAMLAVSMRLKPEARIADRLPKKVWDMLAEAMKGPKISEDLKGYFMGILDQDRGALGQTARTLEKDVEAQLGTLRTSTAPNERFFAVDRLRSILSVNLVPLAPEIRDKAMIAILEEVDKETDRMVRNGLIDLVLNAGGQEHLKVFREVLERHLDDQAWKFVSSSQVNLEPYGQLYYNNFPTRTMALMGLVSRAMDMPLDKDLRALAERLVDEPDPDIRCLCYGYILATTDADGFLKAVLGLVKSGIPFRAVLHERLRPLFGPAPIDGGIEFNVKEGDADGLVAYLKENYKDASNEAKASIRRILIQSPSKDLKEILNEEYRRTETDQVEMMTDYWLQLGFLSGLGPAVRELYAGDQEDFIRAYTQVRLETVLEDPEASARIAVVDMFGVMRAMGLKVAPMKLLNAVTNGRLSFEAITPALDVLTEGDWDNFLSETVKMFNLQLDGIEHKLSVILAQFCPYIRNKYRKWYEDKWYSILWQMVFPRSWQEEFAGFWTADDKDLLLFWLKEDARSDNFPLVLRLMWRVADQDYLIKKVVPIVTKNWMDGALEALGDMDRLEQPLDIVSQDKAFALLYEKVWQKGPKSRKALMERWFSLEHFKEAQKAFKKAKGNERSLHEKVIKAGLEGFSEAAKYRYSCAKLDPAYPLPGTGALLEVLKKVHAEDDSAEAVDATLALFCSLTAGWGPFLELAGPLSERLITAKASGKLDTSRKQFFVVTNMRWNLSLPGMLLKAIEGGHIEALQPLMRLLDNGLVTGAEGWVGSDGKYEMLMDLVVKAGGDPAAIGKALEGHQDLQLAYLLRLRKEALVAKAPGSRPKPSDFGANPIVYDL